MNCAFLRWLVAYVCIYEEHHLHTPRTHLIAYKLARCFPWTTTKECKRANNESKVLIVQMKTLNIKTATHLHHLWFSQIQQMLYLNLCKAWEMDNGCNEKKIVPILYPFV